MNALTAAGLASMAFSGSIIIFTATRHPGAGQTPRDSVVEALTNTGVGFAINYAANLVILPLVLGVRIGSGENFWMGCIYTAVSVVRQLVVRRWFNAKEVYKRNGRPATSD